MLFVTREYIIFRAYKFTISQHVLLCMSLTCCEIVRYKQLKHNIILLLLNKIKYRDNQKKKKKLTINLILDKCGRLLKESDVNNGFK